jgi:hypothetical protein
MVYAGFRCKADKFIVGYQAEQFCNAYTLSQGVPIEAVSSMLGHRDLRTTSLYAKITNEKIDKDIAELEVRIEGRYSLIQIEQAS